MQFVIIIAVIVIGAVIAYMAWLQEKKRREALAALAAEFGWRFDPSRDSYHDEEYAHFEMFRKGHGRRAFNTLTGTLKIDGEPYHAKAGDFVYKVTSGSGKNRRTRTYKFSYLIVDMPWPHAPDLLIRPEGLFDKLTDMFGFDDIDFESAEFSKKYCVKSPDRKFAYAVIDPRMMEFLLATKPGGIDIEHGRCLLSDGRSRWAPEQFRSSIGWMTTFFDTWPDHVKADLVSRHANHTS